jgi:hypothetical protein
MARVVKIAALVGLAKAAQDYAKKNPEQVSSTLGKVEQTVGRTLGPKYAGAVGKGGEVVRKGLGIHSAGPSGATGAPGSTPPPPASSGPVPPTAPPA